MNTKKARHPFRVAGDVFLVLVVVVMALWQVVIPVVVWLWSS